MIEFVWRHRKDFFSRFYRVISEAEVFGRGAEAAFYFLFSLFPMLFFLISILGLIIESSEGLKHELFSYLGRLMPDAAFGIVQKTVEEIVSGSTPGKLTVGLALTLWSASAGLDGIRNALNSVYGLRETRSWWKTKLQSVLITLVMIVLFAAALIILFYGWQIARAGLLMVGLQLTAPFVLVSVQWISLILLMLFAFEVIFNLIPNWTKPRWEWITPGSVFAILLWVIITVAFRFYFDQFNNYNRAYGSLGAVMILMIWLYLMAVVGLFGGAVNAVIYSLEKAADGDADQLNLPDKDKS